MKKFLGSLCILCLLVTSCVKEASLEEIYMEGYIRNRSYNSNYYSSGFAAEGNDYYYINENDPIGEYDYVDTSCSIPSRYIISIEAKYQILSYGAVEFARNRGKKKDLETPKIDKFILNIHDIGTKELIKQIDVKKLIEESGEDVFIAMDNFDTIAIEGEPYLTINVGTILHSTEDNRPKSIRWFCVNLITGDYLIKEVLPEEFRRARQSELDIFNERFEFWVLNAPGIKYQGKLFVYSMNYWDGCKDISFYLNEIPVDNEKLYSKFPTLKADVEKLKKEEKNACINIILTGNPSYEEIASYMAEGDYEPTFDGMVMDDYQTKDGQKRTIHSAEEYYEYYKYYKPENMVSEWLSPIFPREN